VQIEVEVTLGDDALRIVGYEPRTSLATSVVGEIEETVATEDARNWGGSVGASLSLPGMDVAEIGPSVELSDSRRTVRTEKVRRRPQLDAVVVAGNASRGRGVFYQLRPAAEVTLEGAHHFTLTIAAPLDVSASTICVKCRALAAEDWLLFERQAEVSSGQGQVTVDFPKHVAATRHEPAPLTSRSLHHTERPCPWCDGIEKITNHK
jgi:hypothetical protein